MDRSSTWSSHANCVDHRHCDGFRVGGGTLQRNRKVHSAVILRVDTSRQGNWFAPGAVGLSMEAAELSRGRLTATHYRLVRLMRLLGPSLLRIGGGTVDSSWWTSSGEPRPSWATASITPADLSVLHRLLVATGWRVLLGVNFGHRESARVADEARYSQKILGASLVGIEIGNEPNSYTHRLDKLRSSPYDAHDYLRDAEVYYRALTAAVPGVAVYGPALSDTRWLTQMGAAAGVFTELTQHYYPIHQINTCPTATPAHPQSTSSELLSPIIRQRENDLLQTLSHAGSVAGRPTRIGETNSVSCAPTVYTNPGFAGALWSLDWALRAASSGVRGLNFHGGPYPCILYPESPICAAGDGKTANAGNVTAQPEYYGMLAARHSRAGASCLQGSCRRGRCRT